MEQLAPHLPRGACVVSCTSGVPTVTKRLANSLRERFGALVFKKREAETGHSPLDCMADLDWRSSGVLEFQRTKNHTKNGNRNANRN